MKDLLTKDEKKYLNRICRYLGSIGMEDAFVEFEMNTSYFDCDDIDWKNVTHFSNNYVAEIPEGLIPIFQKSIYYVCENELIKQPEYDDINWGRVMIEIDCKTREISISYDYSYYDVGNTESITHSLEEDDNEDLMELFDTLENDEEISDRVLQLDYNGSGDSGYLEDDFTNGDSVPAVVSDYAYRMLENNFGGWEINEGSQGNFEIDLDRKEITLNHTMNIEETERDTVWEEKF
jgi:hypothetical protein